jgi:CRP-like cAMP-binding protein
MDPALTASADADPLALHLMRLRARDHIEAEEEAAIRRIVREYRDISADEVFIREGEELTSSTILIEGIMCRYKDLRGGERQITELHVAGDFVDLHSFTLKRLDHDVMALSPSRVAIVPHERLADLTAAYPHLARVYWFSTNLDAAIHREWQLSLGRRSAVSRLAHIFCELEVRLGLVGLTEGGSYALPVTQMDLSECLGLTPVHLNRVLQELRADGLLEFRSGRVTIRDRVRLERLAEFDPNYLYLEKRSR